MEMYGKMIEFKDALFESVSPYATALSPSYYSSIMWSQDVGTNTNYDPDNFYFDFNTNPYRVWCIEPGMYSAEYNINSESTTSSRWNTTTTVIVANIKSGLSTNDNGVILPKTYSYEMSTSSEGYNSNSASATIKIASPNTWVELQIGHTSSRTSVFMQENAVTMTLKRIRPITVRDL